MILLYSRNTSLLQGPCAGFGPKAKGLDVTGGRSCMVPEENLSLKTVEAGGPDCSTTITCRLQHYTQPYQQQKRKQQAENGRSTGLWP